MCDRPSEASAHSLLMATPFPFVPVATDVPQGHRPLSTEQLQSFLASKSPSEDVFDMIRAYLWPG